MMCIAYQNKSADRPNFKQVNIGAPIGTVWRDQIYSNTRSSICLMKSRTGGDENKLFGSGKELFMATEHLQYYSVWWRPRFWIYKPVKTNFTQEVDRRRLSVFKNGSSLFQGRSESAIWYGGSRTTGGSEEPFLVGSKPMTLRSNLHGYSCNCQFGFCLCGLGQILNPPWTVEKFSSCKLCHWDFSAGYKTFYLHKMCILASSIFPLFAQNHIKAFYLASVVRRSLWS